MSVESINAGQQIANAKNREIAKEEEVKQVKQKGSTKDIIAALGILASIGVATVAIIKSKNAKKELQEALKKAEEEKKKLADEAKKAADDAKKAAEDVNKKVEEAVNKVKEELKNSKPHSGGGRPKTSGGRKGGVPTRTTRGVAPVKPTPTTPTHVEPAPVVEPKPTAEVKPEPVVEPKVEPTPATTAHTEPAPIAEPKPTVEVKPEPVVEPKVEPKPTSAAAHVEPTPVVKPETATVEPITTAEPSVINPRKPYTKPEASVLEIQPKKTAEELKQEEQIAKAGLDAKESDMAQVARNIIDEKPAPQAIDVLGNIDLSKPINRMSDKELLFEYNALKDVVKNMSVTDPATKRFLEIKGELVNKRAFKVTKDGITKREGVLDDYTKEGLEIINKQEADAKKALEESNARNAKWVEEQQAKREAEYEQMYLNAEKEKIDGLTKQLDEQEAAAKKAIEESNARNAQWVEEQQAIKQDEYEAMYLNAERERDIANGARVLERGNLDIYLDKVYPGYTRQLEEGKNDIIFVPRATKLSDGVQKVTDFVSEKWGKFRGLFGKKKLVKAQPEPKPFEPSAEGVAAWAEHLKNKRIEEGKQVKEQVAKQLRDKTDTVPVQEFIDSKVPRKHNKRYHDKLQKEYDKMAEGVNAQEAATVKQNAEHQPIRQPIAEKQEPAMEIKEEAVVEPKPEVVETQKKNKPVISEQKKAADGIKYLNRQEAKAKKAIEESNARNAKWVEEQQAKREAEYEKMYLEAEAEAKREAQGLKEGLAYLDRHEVVAKRTIEESNKRNAEWVKEQHAKREAEYEQMYLNAEKEKIQDIVKQLDEQETAAKKALEESNARNAKWVEEQHAKREAEYEKMYLEAEAEAKHNAAPIQVQEKVAASGGLNQLPQSFNDEQIAWLRAHHFIKDTSVLEFPRLYSSTHGKIEVPLDILTDNQIRYFESNGFVRSGDVLKLDVSKSLPKNEKSLAELMEKLDHEHRVRRIQDANERVGIGNETAFYNPIDVPNDIRYNYRKYRSMAEERPNDADWQPEMTREEFMQNIEQYVNEEIARTTPRHHHSHKKETYWQKLKKIFGS